MILDKEVEVKLAHKNIKYYEELGYEIPRYKDTKYNMVVKRGTTINVKINDLMPKSKVKVLCKCDNPDCKSKPRLVKYQNLKRSDGKYYCYDCAVQMDDRNDKLRQINIGRKASIDTKRKMSNVRIGTKRSEETKRKMKEIYNTDEYKAKRKKTCIENGIWKTKKERTKYKNYWLDVYNETHKHIEDLFKSWDGKDYYTKENILILIDRDITVDHKISVYYGFNNNIDAKEIGKLENLCICSRKTNSNKNRLTEEQFLIKRGI
jgi:hypothetical protein